MVELLGPLPHAEVMRYIASAQIMALPCVVTDDLRSDGIPYSLIEAMASGVPVVTTAVAGIPELVKHMETGMLVPQRDAVALADALEVLHRQSELRSELAAAGRAHVLAEFDLAKNVANLATLFRSLL
jgi:glycosyltransferase involved in cell wall biosynthesis